MSHNISYLNIDFAKRKEKHVMTYRYIRIVFWGCKRERYIWHHQPDVINNVTNKDMLELYIFVRREKNAYMT
jgi:hypothetical protein